MFLKFVRCTPKWLASNAAIATGAAVVLSLLATPIIAQERHGPEKKNTVLQKIQVAAPLTGEVISRTVENIDGMGLVEGDILIGPIGNSQLRAALVKNASSLWPGGAVPYEIENSHPDTTNILKAMNEVARQTNVCFYPRGSESNYVKVVHPTSSSCSSYVGRRGGEQEINIRSCSFGSIQHEFLHAVGVEHEQKRLDRNSYVTVNLSNVQSGKEHNFEQYSSSTGQDFGSYDYGSIMHYPKDAFSTGGDTIVVKSPPAPSSTQIGQRSSLSSRDVAGVNALYPNTQNGCQDCYNGNSIKAVASGDFDADGKDDIATAYYYGNNHTTIHVLRSDGSRFVYQGDAGWWRSQGGYNGAAIKGMESGDFNADGKDDLAIVYHYGGTHTRVHVLLSTGSSFAYQGNTGWWGSHGYNGAVIKGVQSGDFNADGKDDLAIVYHYGGNHTRIHVLLSTGSSFAYQGNAGWWGSHGYNGAAIKGVVAGDFGGDSNNDLAIVYHYGGNHTRIHVLLSTGSSFAYQGSTGWWGSHGYNGAAIKGVVAGDFGGDSHSDIAIAYDYGNNHLTLHTLLTEGQTMNYQGKAGWWRSLGGYNGSAIRGMVAGQFDGTGKQDLTMPYYYGQIPGAKTNYHTWLSTGQSLAYQSNRGWWGCL